MGTKKKLNSIVKLLTEINDKLGDNKTLTFNQVLHSVSAEDAVKAISGTLNTIKPDFVLPEKWCVLDSEIVSKWASEKFGCCNIVSIDGTYLNVGEELKYGYSFNREIEGYTEITTEQFIEHVLNKKPAQPEPEEIDWSKPGQVVESDGIIVVTSGKHNDKVFSGMCVLDTKRDSEDNYSKHWYKELFKLHKEPVTIQND